MTVTVGRTRLAHWLMVLAFVCFVVATILFIPGMEEKAHLPWLIPLGLSFYVAALLARGE